jgi:6-phosphogluconolactonase
MTLSSLGNCAVGFLGLVSVSGMAATATPLAPARSCLVYIGTYTNANSKGIYAWRMDLASGSLTSLGLVGETPNPSFLDVSPDHRFLYAANEVGSFEGKKVGSVSAFSIDAISGKLTLLNQQSSGGAGPCHVAVDHTGKNVLVANYDSGNIECLPVQPDGRLGAPTAFAQHSGKGPNATRQEGPHAHCMTVDPANQFVFACDLGLDKLMTYRFDASKGTLTAATPAFSATEPGAGPRHLIFSSDGHEAYVINELTSAITRYGFDPASGALTSRQTVPLLPAHFTGMNTAAEIVLHPNGKFLYGSNRGDDSIAEFAVDAAAGGNLTFVDRFPTQGKTPRSFAIDPTGKFLLAAHQNSNSIVVFNVDPVTGKLTPAGKVLNCGSPVCVKFVTTP